MVFKPSLGLAIITYNEERNIQRCIDSIYDIVEEIIVLDSFSTDQTHDICCGYAKVKFYQHVFDGHVQQKNRALEKCTTDWVLCLDADEEVSVELNLSIQSFLNNCPEHVAGVKFPRLTVHMKRFIRHGGWYPNARYRLIKRGQAYWDGENPHDKIILSGKGIQIKGDLIHYSFKDLSHQVNTINQFSSIAALVRYNKGKRFFLFRLLFKPISKFLELYILKLGVLDGLQGFIIAVSSSYSAFLKEAKLYELFCLNTEKPSNLSPLYKKER
ncbi:MAG: glycosyltransferase family 2 protein [Desulfobacterales bacterium]|nr:glycosyltransferase family 2 protein [Desulfobacterales bacterium]